MRLTKDIDLDSIVPETGFQPLPNGWYSATISKAEVKATKAGTGEYIAIRYDIIGPTNQGRVVFGNLNIRNPNPTAEEIAEKQIKHLTAAIGLSGMLSDTDQLIGKSCDIKLAIRLSEQYGDSNDVKGWRAPKGAAAMPSAPLQLDAAIDQQVNAATPPWAQ